MPYTVISGSRIGSRGTCGNGNSSSSSSRSRGQSVGVLFSRVSQKQRPRSSPSPPHLSHASSPLSLIHPLLLLSLSLASKPVTSADSSKSFALRDLLQGWQRHDQLRPLQEAESQQVRQRQQQQQQKQQQHQQQRRGGGVVYAQLGSAAVAASPSASPLSWEAASHGGTQESLSGEGRVSYGQGQGDEEGKGTVHETSTAAGVETHEEAEPEEVAASHSAESDATQLAGAGDGSASGSGGGRRRRRSLAKRKAAKKTPPPSGPVGPRNKPSVPCDFNEGSWQVDSTLPHYSTSTCPFIPPGYNCEDNGRPDLVYQKYRWVPTCSRFQRFDTLTFLRAMTGKIMGFAGDELSTLAMYSSLRCRVHVATNGGTRDFVGLIQTKNASGFSVPAFKFTAILIRAPFATFAQPESLLRNSIQDPWHVSVDWMPRNFVNLVGRSHLVVFSTGLWWNQALPNRQYYDNGRLVKMSNLAAYSQAIEELEKFFKARTVFTGYQGIPYILSYPVTHNPDSFLYPATSCAFINAPLTSSADAAYVTAGSNSTPWIDAVEGSIDKKLRLLDVAGMSTWRADAHIGRYSTAINTRRVNCNLWCLPGVPDHWFDFLWSNMILERQWASFGPGGGTDDNGDR